MPTATASAPRSTSSPSLADLAAATPADRDRVVDLLRGVSILVVALGHWLLAVVTVGADGHVTGANALATVPALRGATWIFQVMPLFFLVGGYANAVSWRSARGRGTPYGTWLAGRVQRLVGPTTVFVLVWSALAVVLGVSGIAPGAALAAARLVAIPLWFLAVYVIVVAVAPAMLAVHRRFGVAVPVVLTLIAAVVDLLRLAGVPLIGWVNFAVVWLIPQQLGFLWVDGRLTGRRRTAPLLAAAGLTALVVLTTIGPYPVSMVGVPGAPMTNTSPPTVALVALALFQLGVVLLVRPRLARWLERPRVWASVVLVNARAMTVFLWHLTALAIVAVLVVPSGLTGSDVPGSAGWWLSRPLWFAVLLAALVPLVAVFGRLERIGGAGRQVTPVRASIGVAGLTTAFALLAAQGFTSAGRPGLPVGALVSLAVARLAFRVAPDRHLPAGGPSGAVEPRSVGAGGARDHGGSHV